MLANMRSAQPWDGRVIVADSVGKRTRSGLYWVLGLKIPFEIVRFAVSIEIARLLEPGDFGIVSIATILIYYANALTNFGLGQALVQRQEISDEHVNSVFTIDFSVSAVLAGSVYFLAPLIADFFRSPESRAVIEVMSLVFVITAVHDLPHALLRRNLEYRVIAVVDTTKETAVLIISLALALLGFKYWSIVWGQLIPAAFAALYLWAHNPRKPRLMVSIGAVKELTNFGMWSFARSQIYFLATRVDRLIVGRSLGVSALGIYDKAKSFSQMPYEALSTNISTVLFSSVSRMQCDDRELGRILLKGLLVTSLLSAPLYCGLFLVGPTFVPVVLGGKWNAMVRPLQVMCAAGVFASLNGVLSAVAVGANRYREYTVQQIMATGALVVACLALVPYGLVAVAGGVAGYAAVNFVAGTLLIKKSLRVTWRSVAGALFPALVGSAFMAACVAAFERFFVPSVSPWGLVGEVAIGAGAYLAAVLLMPYASLAEVRSAAVRDLARVRSRVRLVWQRGV